MTEQDVERVTTTSRGGTIREFDFRRPPAGELERQATTWSNAAAQRAVAIWSRLLPFPATLSTESAETKTVQALLNGLPEDAIGFRITPSSQDETLNPFETPLLLAMSRPVVIALNAGLLGETPFVLPDDRDLSSLENSLSGYLLQELFLNSFERAWPLRELPIKLTPGEGGPPRTVWRVPAEDMVVMIRLKLSGPFGEHPVFLVLPRTERFEKLVHPVPRPQLPPPADPKLMEALVREMAVDFSVLLGEADLTMGELARLKAGDLVILRQKISDPLVAEVCGARKFHCWPGAIGTRAAIQIEAPADK